MDVPHTVVAARQPMSMPLLTELEASFGDPIL